MATSQLGAVVQQVRRAFLVRDGATLTDVQLLECFVAHRDEAAFAAMVRRHGPMVWSVCRRVLRAHHDAEDAFQATFLVLVRRASVIKPREMLPNWLHGVAYQTARRVQAALARRQQREKQLPTLPEPAESETTPAHDLRLVLDRELSRLPDRYRTAILLCDLEGLTRREAAHRLGLPEGTLSGHLTRGRTLLAKRLARHGALLSGGALASVLAQQAASASAPAEVIASTLRAASSFATGPGTLSGAVSPAVACLAEQVLRAMLLSNLKAAAALLASLALVLSLAAPSALTLVQTGAAKSVTKPATAPNYASGPSEKKPAWVQSFVLKHEHPVTIVACGSEWSAAGDEGGNLFLWETKTGKNRTLKVRGGKGERLNPSVDRLQFTPDGKHLFAVIHERRALSRLNLQEPNKREPGLMAGNPMYLGVSADGEFWLESHVAGRVLALRPNPWTRGAAVEYESIKFEAEIVHAIMSADDKWLAVVTLDGKLHLHDRASLRETQTIAMKPRTVNAIQFSPNGKRLGVSGQDGLAKVYDPADGKEIATLTGHGGIVFAIAFSPEGNMVVTGGDDTTARVWDADTGAPLAVLHGHADSVWSVAFVAGGETIVTGSADKTVKTWRLAK